MPLCTDSSGTRVGADPCSVSSVPCCCCAHDGTHTHTQCGGSVYALPLGGTLLQCPFTIGGSGSAYIYGWCDDAFKENMTRYVGRLLHRRTVHLKTHFRQPQRWAVHTVALRA